MTDWLSLTTQEFARARIAVLPVAAVEQHGPHLPVGTDTYITSRWHRMPEIHAETRAWLAKLPPAVAEKMAWRNGAKLFGISEATFTGAAPVKKAD